jgi:hypothetical protein
MRSVKWMGVLAIVAVGCGGPQHSGQGFPGSRAGASDAGISGESVIPGDPRVPSKGTTVTTKRPGFTGIGRTSSPVPHPTTTTRLVTSTTTQPR